MIETLVNNLPRFKVMINGDRDFVEEYGLEDEHREWRAVPPSELARVRAALEQGRRQYDEWLREHPLPVAAVAVSAMPAAGSKRKADVATVCLPSSAVTLVDAGGGSREVAPVSPAKMAKLQVQTWDGT